MREYLLRGGFFMCDDFHGTREWASFMRSMSRVFPDRPVVEIESKDPIFHTIYDLDNRYQVPGAQYLETGRIYEHDGFEPRWRGIYDDKGRLMVAICHNMDLGDSWEHADNPAYPGEVFGAWHSHRRELRRLLDDSLAHAILKPKFGPEVMRYCKSPARQSLGAHMCYPRNSSLTESIFHPSESVVLNVRVSFQVPVILVLQRQLRAAGDVAGVGVDRGYPGCRDGAGLVDLAQVRRALR